MDSCEQNEPLLRPTTVLVDSAVTCLCSPSPTSTLTPVDVVREQTATAVVLQQVEMSSVETVLATVAAVVAVVVVVAKELECLIVHMDHSDHQETQNFGDLSILY